MDIKFSKGNIEITQSMHRHAESKMKRLGRHLSSISHVDITVKKQAGGFMVDALVHNEQARFPQVHAQANSKEYHSAIDVLEDKLIRQIETLKEKREQARHNSTEGT